MIPLVTGMPAGYSPRSCLTDPGMWICNGINAVALLLGILAGAAVLLLAIFTYERWWENRR